MHHFGESLIENIVFSMSQSGGHSPIFLIPKRLQTFFKTGLHLLTSMRLVPATP